jgi:hypothetical protein
LIFPILFFPNNTALKDFPILLGISNRVMKNEIEKRIKKNADGAWER